MTTTEPTPSPKWGPFTVPEDASPEALRAMWPDEIVLALEDVCMVVQRTATDEDSTVSDEEFETLLDIRARLGQEIHRRLLDAHRLTELNRRLLDGTHRRLGNGGGCTLERAS